MRCVYCREEITFKLVDDDCEPLPWYPIYAWCDASPRSLRAWVCTYSAEREATHKPMSPNLCELDEAIADLKRIAFS